MPRLHVEEQAVIHALPSAIYEVLADYRNEHPQILPREYFRRVEVETGGKGAGTVFNTEMRVMGQTRRFRMKVDEPEPGRVLSESDLASDLVTTFTLTSIEDGQATQVRIASDWTPAGGMAGWLERLTSPRLMRRIYRQELRQIAEYMALQTTSGA